MQQKMTFDEFLSSPQFVEMYTQTMERQKFVMQNKYKQLNQFAQTGKTVFIGDSIVEYFPLQELLGGGIYNRGIGGDTSAETLKRLPDTALPLKPRKVFILVGTNDIQSAIPQEQTVENVKQIFRLLRQDNGDIQINLISCIPVNEKSSDGYVRTAVGIRTNEKIKALNLNYKALCQSEGANFIDVYPLLEKEGSLPEDYSDDGLHPTVDDYLPICGQIKKYL